MIRSSITRKTPLARGSQMKARRREPRAKGLGQILAEALGLVRKVVPKEPTVLRSKQHRRNVAALPCLVTGLEGSSQCAHANFSKGGAMKACDTLCFPLSPAAHEFHDRSGINRDERRRLELIYVDRTRAELIARNQWTPQIESFYQRAIEPMKQVVGDA
jgi:hypothetical protein